MRSPPPPPPVRCLAGVIVVYVTAPSAEVGTSLARALVEAQLVACVNLLPGVTSIYRWQVRVALLACAPRSVPGS